MDGKSFFTDDAAIVTRAMSRFFNLKKDKGDIDDQDRQIAQVLNDNEQLAHLYARDEEV